MHFTGWLYFFQNISSLTFHCSFCNLLQSDGEQPEKEEEEEEDEEYDDNDDDDILVDLNDHDPILYQDVLDNEDPDTFYDYDGFPSL